MSHNGSSNGKVAPAAFPPPVDSRKEFIKRGLDDEDELIEVGVAIVGGGTAGLACANRLLQLLADDPETLEQLGEVPVAVIEKAKTCGGHNLSGAVMRPKPLEELFPDLTREQWREQGFAFGEVKKESVYMLTGPKSKLLGPDPCGAELQEPRQRGDLGLGARALPAAAGRGRRRLHPHRDGRDAARRRGRPRRRFALWRQGSWQGRRAARQLRAGHRHQGEGDRARRGLLGPSDGRGDPGVRPRQGSRAAGLGARRQGGLEGKTAARSGDSHVRAAVAVEGIAQVRAARWHMDLPDEERRRRGSRLDRLRSRSQLRGTRRRRLTICCRRSRPTHSSKGSSRGASASRGVPRRCPAVATGRCRSYRCPAPCSSATRVAWSTRRR